MQLNITAILSIFAGCVCTLYSIVICLFDHSIKSKSIWKLRAVEERKLNDFYFNI